MDVSHIHRYYMILLLYYVYRILVYKYLTYVCIMYSLVKASCCTAWRRLVYPWLYAACGRPGKIEASPNGDALAGAPKSSPSPDV